MPLHAGRWHFGRFHGVCELTVTDKLRFQDPLSSSLRRRRASGFTGGTILIDGHAAGRPKAFPTRGTELKGG